MGAIRTRIGDIELIRVGYADVTVPADRVGITIEQIRAVPWAEPLWAEDGNPRAGAAVWVIRAGDAVIAVDPAQAADDILRHGPDARVHQEAFAAVMSDAGVPREQVTHSIMTHAEGIGMWAWRDDNDEGESWTPFFPNAPLLASEAELAAFDATIHPE